MDNSFLKKYPLFVFLFELLLLRIILAVFIPLTGDEAYHIEWARHLDWCYYDHPGMVAWIMKPFIVLFGESLISVRFQAICSGIVFAVIAYSLGQNMFPDSGIGKKSALLTAVVPLTAVVSLLVSTDTPLTVFWALALLFFFKAAEKGALKDWVLTGVFLGCAFLSKFLAFGFLPAAFLYLIISPEKRKHFKTPGPWIALLITGLLFLPVVIWNAQNEWLTFKFNFVSRQNKLDFSLFSYLAGQFFFFSPVVAGFFIFGFANRFKEHFTDSRRLFLLLFAGIPLGGFAFISLFREVGGHWPAMALVPLCVYFAAFSDSSKLWKTGLITGAVLSLLVIGVISFVLVSGPDGFESFAKSVVKDDERALKLTGEVFYEPSIARYAAFLREFNNGFSATESYSFSSMLTYYDPGKEHYYLWASKSFYGRNYYLWDDMSKFKGRTMVFVCFYKWLDEEFLEQMSKHFTRIVIHTFNDKNMSALITKTGMPGIAGLSHPAPRGMEAFAVLVGSDFSGEEMSDE